MKTLFRAVPVCLGLLLAALARLACLVAPAGGVKVNCLPSIVGLVFQPLNLTSNCGAQFTFTPPAGAKRQESLAVDEMAELTEAKGTGK